MSSSSSPQADFLDGVAGRSAALREVSGPSDWALFVRICAFATIVPLLVRLPLPRQAALLSRPVARRSPADTVAERIDRLLSVGVRVAHPVVRTGCLTRGLTVFWFARRAGIPVELVFGLDPGARSDGHCWLERDGLPFMEATDPCSRFSEIHRWPPAR